MGVYTKTGDKGQTSLYTGQRVDKDSLRVETYGTIDEMNSALGMARAFCENKDVQQLILALQRDIPSFMADLASIGTRPMINEYHIKDMEQEMDRIENEVGALGCFLIPGSTKGGAMLDLAPLDIAAIIAHIEIDLPVSVKHHFVSAARANHLYNLQTFQKVIFALFVI